MSARARGRTQPLRSSRGSLATDVDRSIRELQQLSQKVAKDIDDAIKKLDEALRKLEESILGGGK